MMSSRIARPALAAARRATPRMTPAIRTYASPAGETSTRPPIELFGVDGTYASALTGRQERGISAIEIEANKNSAQYTAAAKSNSLDSASKALASLGQVLKSDPKLGQILHAPTLSSKDKSDIIAELEKHTGGQDKAKIVINFMETLAENNRLGLLQGICEKFGQLIGASKGEMDLIITSAQKVDDKMIKRIEAAIAKSEYSQGKKLKVVTKVNPEILGGLIVEIGERSIDFSVSNKILKMNKMLQDAV